MLRDFRRGNIIPLWDPSMLSKALILEERVALVWEGNLITGRPSLCATKFFEMWMGRPYC